MKPRKELEIYANVPQAPPEVRLTADPLIRIVTMENGNNTVTDLARRLGAERHSIYKWIDDGIELHHAERVSQYLGLHPSHIWGPEYHIAVYMDEIRRQIMATRKSQKLAIRRSIARKEKKNEAARS